MRGLGLLALVWLSFGSLGAATLEEVPDIITREGRLALTDGISVLTFEKDGKFLMRPTHGDGRMAMGTWRWSGKSPHSFLIEAEWRWTNKYSVPPDMRRVLFTIEKFTGKQMKLRGQTVHEAEFSLERRAAD